MPPLDSECGQAQLYLENCTFGLSWAKRPNFFLKVVLNVKSRNHTVGKAMQVPAAWRDLQGKS
jgi:hypothetical protein